MDGFNEIFKGTISCLINDGMKHSCDIADKLGCKSVVTESICGYFKDLDYIKAIMTNRGRGVIICGITAQGQRYFENKLL